MQLIYMSRKTYTPCTPTKRATIALLRDQGKSLVEVAAATGLGISSVHYNKRRTRELGSNYSRRQGSGRPLEFTPHKQRRAAREIRSARAHDAAEVR